MKDKNNFQLIILIVFLVSAVVGILVFAGLIPIGKSKKSVIQGTATMWGTVRSSVISETLQDFTRLNPTLSVRYVEKNPATFDQELLEALASQNAPDLFILPDELIFHYKNKIMPIPYASFPQASFRSTFSGAGEIYLDPNGVLAFPLAVDPMVMYYDRSVFDAKGLVNPPAYWNDFVALAPVLNEKTDDGKIIKSMVALGQFANVLHAKDLLTMLFMQAGNPIVKNTEGFLSSALLGSNLEGILGFYTSFADPLNALYSWNRSLLNSQDAFSSGQTAIYFGFGSELSQLSAKNPNKDFYLAPVPQIKNSSFKLTAGHTYGISVLSSTKNSTVAFSVASKLATGDFAKQFANGLLLAPARRDLLAQKPVDQYFPIIYDSAIYARSWLDPAPTDTNAIFQKLVENVLSGNMTPTNALNDASSKLDFLLTS